MKKELLQSYGEKRIKEADYWVYILICKEKMLKVKNYGDLKRMALNRIGKEPNWLRMAFEAEKLYYVGQTENIELRLGQHFKQQNGSEFTTLFNPCEIKELHPCQNRYQAERLEEKLAKRYYSTDKVFAYWN